MAADQDRLPAESLKPAGVSEGAQPGGRVQGERDEGRQDDQASSSLPAECVGPKEEEGKHEPQRKRDRLGLEHELDALDREAGGPRDAARIAEDVGPAAPSSDVPDPGSALSLSANARAASSTVASAGQPTTTASPRQRTRPPERLRIRLNRAIPRPA